MDKRDELNQKVREIVTEAEGCKNRRNEYNLKVKEFKKLRDEANRKANAIRNGEWPIGNYRNQPSLKQLLMEKSDLENKQQTQILKKREEEALAMRLKEINRLIDAQSGTRSSMNTARKDADHYHEQMSVYAEKAQQEHDKMMELYKKADYYREKADATHAKFIQCKKEADEAHSKYRECLKKNL